MSQAFTDLCGSKLETFCTNTYRNVAFGSVSAELPAPASEPAVGAPASQADRARAATVRPATSQGERRRRRGFFRAIVTLTLRFSVASVFLHLEPSWCGIQTRAARRPLDLEAGAQDWTPDAALVC